MYMVLMLCKKQILLDMHSSSLNKFPNDYTTVLRKKEESLLTWKLHRKKQEAVWIRYWLGGKNWVGMRLG